MSNVPDEVRGVLKPKREDMIQLRSSITKVNDHISVFMDSFKSTTPLAVVADEVARLHNDVNVIPEGCNVFSEK